MKRVIVVLSCLFLLTFTFNGIAQESVSDATKYAKKLTKKIKKKNFKKFKEAYEQALKDIETTKANAATKKFGYDKLADRIPNWNKMNSTLKEFPNSKIEFEGEVIELKIEDFTALHAEAKEKAGEAHYKEGIKIMDEKTSYFHRKQAIGEFNVALKYSETNKDDIYEKAASIHYDEGVRLLGQKLFGSKEGAITCFSEALKWKKPYKDINELSAKLYFDEAEVKAKSEKEEDLKLAVTYYGKANYWVKDYNGCIAKQTAIKEKAAAALYAKAEEYEKELTFVSQDKALDSYKAALTWISNYKDAAAKIEKIEKNMNVKVLVLPINGGGAIMPNDYSNIIEKKTPNYITTPTNLNDLNSIALWDSKNYELAANKLGYGFIAIKTNYKAHKFEYGTPSSKTTTRDVKKYFKNENGEVEEIDESTYKAAKKIIALAGKDGGVKLYEYSGTVTTTVQQTSVTVTAPIEIWDVRDPKKPILLKTLYYSESGTDKVTTETYKGATQAKPHLTNTGRALKDQKVMATEISGRLMYMKYLAQKNGEAIAKSIHDEVKYRSL